MSLIRKTINNLLPKYIIVGNIKYVLGGYESGVNRFNIRYDEEKIKDFSSDKSHLYKSSLWEDWYSFDESITDEQKIIQKVSTICNTILETLKQKYPSLIIYNKHIPKKGVEYIYLLDGAWIPNTCEFESISKEILVRPVYNPNSNEYEFEYQGKQYTCSYDWAFIENNEENRIKLEKYKKLLEEEKLLKQQIKDLRNSMDGLYF